MVYEILVILASKYMNLMGESGASVQDSALILHSVAAPRKNLIATCNSKSILCAPETESGNKINKE